MQVTPLCVVFFFNDTATTEIYTLSLHDALPIWLQRIFIRIRIAEDFQGLRLQLQLLPLAQGFHNGSPHLQRGAGGEDRKSTRLNSSHANISYAVFCLKKKKP